MNNMQLVVHINVSYLNDHITKSNYGRYFVLVWNQHNHASVGLSVCLVTVLGFLTLVATSPVKCILGGLSCICIAQDITVLRLTLNKMVHS